MKRSVRDAAFLGLGFVKTDPRHLRIEIGAPRDRRVVGLRSHEGERNEHIARDNPRLVVGHVREAIGPGDVARGIDVRLRRLKALIDNDTLLIEANAYGFELERARIWNSAGGNEQRLGADFAAFLHGDNVSAVPPHAGELCAKQALDAVSRERELHEVRSVGILLGQKPLAAMCERHLHAEPREDLRQFAANRPSAEHKQTGGFGAQPVEDRFVGEEADAVQTVDLGQRRARAGGNNEMLRAQTAAVDRDFMGRDEGRFAAQHFDSELFKALLRVVRRDVSAARAHPLHHALENERRFCRFESPAVGVANAIRRSCRSDERLARHAAEVQAIAPHVFALDQRHASAESSRRGGSDKAGSAGTNDYRIVAFAAHRRDVSVLERRGPVCAARGLPARREQEVCPPAPQARGLLSFG